MKKRTIINLIFASLLIGANGLFAQNDEALKKEILSDVEKMSGIYYSYTPSDEAKAVAPKGYKPFYISSYLRHGIRWNSSSGDYTNPLRVLNEAKEKDALTELGTQLLEQVRIVVEDAEDRYGDLMPMGEQEHRGIAERMYNAYPEVFKKDAQICSFSTPVPRCILSMAAFDERLKELNPKLQISRESSKRNQYFMCNTSCADRIPQSEIQPIVGEFASKILNNERFMKSIFKDPSTLRPGFGGGLMNNVFTMAGTLKGRNDINFSLYEYFTPDEMFNIWQQSNHWLYVAHGPSAQFADSTEYDARFLINHIITCADSTIANGGCAAHLRFGHDFGIVPLLAAMKIEGASERVENAEDVWKTWQNFNVSPMASNVQLIFYKKSDNDPILVKVLMNERQSTLPLENINGYFYKWQDIKALWTSNLQ